MHQQINSLLNKSTNLPSCVSRQVNKSTASSTNQQINSLLNKSTTLESPNQSVLSTSRLFARCIAPLDHLQTY
ncbi:MAG: hypothetical protein AB7D35_13235 [Bacteroidales bacterium]